MAQVLLLIFTYLYASIPFGLIISKYVAKKDIREFGSGNIGATNVTRLLGKKWGITTFLLDGLKGFIPTLIAVRLYKQDFGDPYICLIALTAILGHVFPIWLKFKGGKAVSTTVLTFLAVDWRLSLVFGIIWGIIYVYTKIVGIASVSGILCMTLASTYLSNFPILMLTLITCIIVLAKHKQNIKDVISKKKEKKTEEDKKEEIK